MLAGSKAADQVGIRGLAALSSTALATHPARVWVKASIEMALRVHQGRRSAQTTFAPSTQLEPVFAVAASQECCAVRCAALRAVFGARPPRAAWLCALPQTAPDQLA